MLHLASWIRESDDALFGQFLAPDLSIQLDNARLGPVDLEAMDGLMVTGGPDVSAQFHPEPPARPELIEDAEPERDAWEFAALRSAYDRGLPIFTICKGTQALNLFLGGSLLLDIPNHNLPEMKSANVQPLRYATAARQRFEMVNSSHHQALDRVADSLEVEAWHAEDGIIEQVRIRDYPWGIGVQYHPERDLLYRSLFEEFLAQIRRRA
jgi:putative glutamine amidotransferase